MNRRAAIFAGIVGLASALPGCDTPDLTIIYRVADGTNGPTCGTENCADVPMACQSVLHLRVLRPSDPNAPFISICEDIRINGTSDMCAIGNVDLPRRELPRETLEIQVTVWPRETVLDPETGDLDCGKVPVQFDSTRGFPIAGAVNPAFGGRAFYQPGDVETVVTLGCTDVLSVNAPSCVGQSSIDVKATVGDFENLPFSVSSTIGDRLAVSIGEPKPFDDGVRTGHALNSANVAALARTVVGPTPAWGAGVDLALQSSACIQVLEDGAQTTASLRCKGGVAPTDTMLDLPGVRLPKATLDQVLAALSLVQFPEAGLTVGIVLDNVGAPTSGQTVSSTAGTVEYVNASRTGLVGGGTSASGIFVSRDAPYGTTFSTFSIEPVNGIGGLVDGKVTVVILQFDTPIGG